jgi:hypothetical protein
VPWCEECARYWTPSAMKADGTCPTCGRSLEKSAAEPITAKNLDLKKLAAGEDGDEDAGKTPWHFKLLLVLLALYLTWRVIQLFT